MQKIIDTVNEMKGVENTKILFDRSKARVFFDEALISEREIMQEIIELGYDVTKID